jgi:hypothetical protein
LTGIISASLLEELLVTVDDVTVDDVTVDDVTVDDVTVDDAESRA